MPNYLGAAAPAMNMTPVVNEEEDLDMVPQAVNYDEIADLPQKKSGRPTGITSVSK
jgi:hypothetical protein